MSRLQQLEGYALTDRDIEDAIHTKVYLYYPDLYQVRNLDDLFDSKGRAVILYLTRSPSEGHWTCLIKKGKTIEYFDPYGGYLPDTERSWIPKSTLRSLHEDKPRLSQLIQQSGYKLIYNPYGYQSEGRGISTCGRHCVARLYFYRLSEPQYKKLIESTGLSPDEFVTRLSYSLIGK